jgi:hypothetical protein
VASASSRCSEDNRQDADATIEANSFTYRLLIPADGDGESVVIATIFFTTELLFRQLR